MLLHPLSTRSRLVTAYASLKLRFDSWNLAGRIMEWWSGISRSFRATVQASSDQTAVNIKLHETRSTEAAYRPKNKEKRRIVIKGQKESSSWRSSPAFDMKGECRYTVRCHYFYIRAVQIYTLWSMASRFDKYVFLVPVLILYCFTKTREYKTWPIGIRCSAGCYKA